jgi:hypothetical protein
VLAAAAMGLLAASCVTPPPQVDQTPWLDLLPADRAIYASVDFQSARELVGELASRGGIEEKQVAQVLQRTRRAYLGINPGVDETPEFDLVALGNFSPAAVELRLSFGRLWRKHTLGDGGVPEPTPPAGGRGEAHPQPAPWQPARTWWERPGEGLQVACPRSGVILLSNASVAALLRRLGGSPGIGLPPDAAADLEGSTLFLFFPQLPTGEATQGLSRLPIGSVWLAARTEGTDYRVSAVFALEGAANPQGVERLFRLLIPLLLRRGQVSDPVGKLKAMTLTVSATRARVEDLRLASDEVARLLAGIVAREDPADAGGR